MIGVQLAKDYIPERLAFPLLTEPKIDGVRGLYLTDCFTGRSLMPFNNRYTTKMLSNKLLFGIDSELAAESFTHPDLCRLTSSALNTIDGEPVIYQWCFDLVLPETIMLPYVERHKLLIDRVETIKQTEPYFLDKLSVVPYNTANNLYELNRIDNSYTDYGFEGTIVRNPVAKYKPDKSTIFNYELLRIKHFVEEDATIVGLKEEQINNNPSLINRSGYLEKSSHKDNKIGAGRVGSTLCIDAKTKKQIVVSLMTMTKEQRQYYFNNPVLLLNARIKYRSFPKGVKDKPRFPTFHSFRIPEDVIKC